MSEVRDYVTMQDMVSCKSCGVKLTDDNWQPGWKKYGRKQCKECHDRYDLKSNKNRMWVDSKYIPKSHPLHKPGRYTSFGDAAFTALQKDAQLKEGYVYVITNPAWSDWVKIGMAIDAEDRLNGYQTSSPMRDYELVHAISTPDRARAERVAHKAAAMCGERKGEWFKIDTAEAVTILQHIKEAEDADRQQRESTD